MSVYVSTTYFGDGTPVQHALDKLESIGIRKIELGSNHAPVPREEILQNNNGREYIVHNYFPPNEKNFILNIASSSLQIREKSVKFIKKTISWCQKNNIKYYTIHPGFFAEAISPLSNKGENRNFDLKFSTNTGRNRAKTINETLVIIADLYKFANGKLQLLIENQGTQTSKGVTIFDSVEELKLLKTKVGTKLKFNFNLAHATLSGIDLNNENIFKFVFENSPFFEVSEIKGIYDSHLPVYPKKGVIGNLLATKKNFFTKRNVILEYRNISSNDLKSSFESVISFLA